MDIRNYLETTLKLNGWKKTDRRKNSTIWRKNNCKVQITNWDKCYINNSVSYEDWNFLDKEVSFSDIDENRISDEGFYTKDGQYFSLNGIPSVEERLSYPNPIRYMVDSNPSLKETLSKIYTP